ncbi:MAG: YebC/PmpR family DNA-binding transcriptional regulator [Neisseriaceae bacterium]
MAGHSKWANIKHKKERQDAKKGKLFTKIIREISASAKAGGADITTNSRLRLAIDKAITVNMPKDTIQRAIDKGTGNLEGKDYLELRYEGYGPGGAAVLIDCLTDNKTRTIAEVRHIFSKYGGNLGTDGCVAFQFIHQGYLLFPPGISEEALVEAALETGAIDVVSQEDTSLEVLTDPQNFSQVKEKLSEKGFEPIMGEVTMRADNEVFLKGLEAEKMQALLEALEDLDDVQEVYTSAVILPE